MVLVKEGHGAAVSEYSQKLRASFEAIRGIYEQFTSANETLLHSLLREGEDFHTIEARTKDLDSFEEKVDLPEKEQKYKDISEVTDLSGLRIICYLDEDANRVCQQLAEIYDIDTEHSVNKDEQLEANQFGYRSRHFVVSFSAARASLPEFSRFAGLRAEIQVRTILQHAWAAIDWKLRYKSSIETPQHLRRRVFRVSALLELADDEFSSLSIAVAKLRDEYQKQLDAGDFEIGIDRESVDLFLEKDESLAALVAKAMAVGFSIAPNHPFARDPYGGFITTVTSAGFSTVGQVRTSLAAAVERAEERLSQVFEAWKGPDRPPRLVMSKAGLARLTIVMSMTKDDAMRLISEFPFGEKLQQAIEKVLSNNY